MGRKGLNLCQGKNKHHVLFSSHKVHRCKCTREEIFLKASLHCPVPEKQLNSEQDMTHWESFKKKSQAETRSDLYCSLPGVLYVSKGIHLNRESFDFQN